MEYITEHEIERIASDTGEALRREPKVTIIISGDGTGAYWEGGINGHIFRIKTGVEVTVPESLYRLIRQNAAVSRAAEETARPYRGRGRKMG